MRNSIQTEKNQQDNHLEQYYENAKLKCDSYNSEKGNLTDYDCPKCMNRGNFYCFDAENKKMYLKQCDCIEVRRSLKRIKNSGLGDLFEMYTFENYISKSEWQSKIKGRAYDFLNNSNGNWFYIGGQVGSGKTHICTAIVAELLKSGIPSRYMLWRDEIVNLKSIITNDEEYFKKINPLKTEKVLYIDDLFKTERGKYPTTAEINIAFEILNYRYINRNLITIISSESSINNLLDIDEAVGSRIYERSKYYCTYIEPDRTKNYRLSR